MKSEFNEEEFVYIYIPFEEKDEVKENYKGEVWYDSDNKKWFCSNTNQELIDKYPFKEKKIIEFDEENYVYIDLPFNEKEEAKSIGPIWLNRDKKQWFCLKSNQELIDKYPIRTKKYIKFPYSKKEEYKLKGAKWDPTRKSWYFLV